MTDTFTPDTPPLVCDRTRTAQLLDFAALVAALATAAADRAAGSIVSPDRLVLPLGAGGVLLSMPATSPDVAIHKLVTVVPANAARQLPTIQGVVTVCDAATGRPQLLLDGPEVTGRRTAAVSLLAVRALLGRAPAEVLIVGTGVQAAHHVRAIAALHPASRVWVRSRDAARAARFCDGLRAAHADLQPAAPGSVPAGVDAVITLTTSIEPVYDEPARAGRVVVGAGAFKPEMAEIGATTLAGSALYADDPDGARHEAGDLLRAGVDWSQVCSLASLLHSPHDRLRPAVFKSVGSAAWDLAAARVALAALRG